MEQLALYGGKPVRQSMLNYGRQWIDHADIEAVVQALRSDFLTRGPQVEAFEEEIATYTGAKYAIAFSSGTAALHGACYAAGLKEGDEVLTSPITFVSSATCAMHFGARPVFVDIDTCNGNIDPDLIEDRITDKTRAIIPVDFSGHPVDIDRINEIAKAHGLIVIEDGAHALGATYKGKKVGPLAGMTMFSFHPVKSITTAEGGIITTNDPDYARILRLFRENGITREKKWMNHSDGPWHYEMLDLGLNYRLSDLQSALGRSQLKKLDFFIDKRSMIANQYNQAFASLDGVKLPVTLGNVQSSHHLYVIQLDLSRFKVGRKEIFLALQAENIGVQVHYIPVYWHPYFRSLAYPLGLCSKGEKFYESALTLPLHPGMGDQDVADVIHGVYKVISYFRK